MPRKRRNVKTRRPEISDAALHFISDGLWALPEETAEEELNAWRFYEDSSEEKIRSYWQDFRDDILADWIAAYPGTRLLQWWLRDAPRMSVRELERRGWAGSWLPHVCVRRACASAEPAIPVTISWRTFRASRWEFRTEG
jgi:hypothetical protein